MASKLAASIFQGATIFLGGPTCMNLYNFWQQIFVSLDILQNRDFLFSIHSHVDIYLKFKSCAFIYEEGIQSITLTKASF
jgi:hypothetical protein